MNYDKLVAHFGGLSKAGRALGVKKQRVWEWQFRRIPSRWQLKAAVKSGGKLKADRKAREEAKDYAAYSASVKT